MTFFFFSRQLFNPYLSFILVGAFAGAKKPPDIDRLTHSPRRSRVELSPGKNFRQMYFERLFSVFVEGVEVVVSRQSFGRFCAFIDLDFDQIKVEVFW